MSGDLEPHVARKLDQIVGARFDEDASHPARRWRNAVLKWIVGAACGVGAAALVFYGIEAHRLPSAAQLEATKPAPKPVTVQIVPAKPP
jgi:hypothetical protein